MARPVVPKGLRRLKEGGVVEALSTSGYWVPMSVLSGSSKQAVEDKYGISQSWPDGPFEFDGEQRHEDLEDTFQREMDRIVGDTDGGDTEGGEGEGEGGEGQGQQSPPPGGGMMEDIVRQIAGGMDEEAAKKVIDDLSTWANTTFVTHPQLDDRLATFQPKHEGGEIDTIIARIEIRDRLEVKLTKDGLFHNQFPMLLELIQAGQHTYLPGPPGTGKSHAAEQVASVLDWRFGAISLGPTTPESRFYGGMDANGHFHEPVLLKLVRHAMENPESGSVFCLDEIDNGHPGILATLNSAMANGWLFAPNGDLLTLGTNMVFVAAANTFGTGPTAQFAGRNKLDAATLDRFAYLPWDTDKAMETTLVKAHLHGDLADHAKAWLDHWRTARKNVETNGLQVFVSMRGCLNGAKLVARGMDLQDAFMVVLGNKLPKDQFDKINPFR